MNIRIFYTQKIVRLNTYHRTIFIFYVIFHLYFGSNTQLAR